MQPLYKGRRSFPEGRRVKKKPGLGSGGAGIELAWRRAGYSKIFTCFK